MRVDGFLNSSVNLFTGLVYRYIFAYVKDIKPLVHILAKKTQKIFFIAVAQVQPQLNS